MVVNEKDWKLYRSKLSGWQENYMAGLLSEYVQFLTSDKKASEKFWWLDKKMRKDKKCAGVLVTDNSRSNMVSHIIELIMCGVVTKDDLSEFSDELKEEIGYVIDSLKTHSGEDNKEE